MLDLSICKNLRIDILIPVDINDNDIDKHNPDSDYYNDICSKTTSNSGTDISLLDRRNKFIEDNMTLCEEDCKFIQYNFTTKKANCSCLVKINLSKIKDIKFDKDKLLNNFIDINNIANIKLLKCYKKVFLIINLMKNYGFYIFLFIFILYFLRLFLFSCKSYYKLINEIDKLIKIKIRTFMAKITTNVKTRNNHLTKQSEIVNKIRKPIIPRTSRQLQNQLISQHIQHQNIFNLFYKGIKKEGNPPIKRSSKIINLKSNINYGSKNKFIIKKNNYVNTNNKTKFNTKKGNILKLNDNELNSLP